jgi:predicted ATP-dependent endonuclease of OLD family
MLLKKASVFNFRSINECENIEFEEKVTVLVGKNESGKTAFLKALHKAKSVEGNIKYNIVDDYPRKVDKIPAHT